MPTLADIAGTLSLDVSPYLQGLDQAQARLQQFTSQQPAPTQLSLNTTQFTSGMGVATQLAGQFTQTVSGMGVPLGAVSGGMNVLQQASSAAMGAAGLGGVAVAATAGAATLIALGAGAVEATQDFVALSDQVRNFSQMSGLSEQTVQGFQYLLGTMGQSADTGQRGLLILQRNVQTLSDQLDQGKTPTSAFALALDHLGISAQAFVKLSPDEQLRVLMDRFAQLEPGANKTALAIDVLGRSGAQLIPAFQQGSAALDQATQQVDHYGASVANTQGVVLEWHKTQTDISTLVEGFGVAVGKVALPAIDGLATGILKVVDIGRTWAADIVNIVTFHEGETKAAQESAKAIEAETESIQKQISAWEASGASQKDILSQLNTQHATLQQRVDAETEAMETLMQKLAQEQGKRSVTISELEKHNTTLKALDDQHNTDVAALKAVEATTSAYKDQVSAATNANQQNAQSWGPVEQGAKGADEAVKNAQKSFEEFAKIWGEVESLSGTAAGQLLDQARAYDTLKTAVDNSVKSLSERQRFEEQFAAAVAFAQSSLDQQRQTLEQLNDTLQTGTQADKDAAQAQIDLDSAVAKLGVDSASSAVALDQASHSMQQAKTDSQGLSGVLKDVAAAIKSVGDEARKTFGQPTQEERQLQLTIDTNKASIDAFNASLANQSPALQQVAALEKIYYQAVLTGASQKDQQKALDDLNQALADTGPAGQAVASQEQQALELGRTNDALQSQLTVLQDHRQILGDAADAQNHTTLTMAGLDAAARSAGITVSGTTTPALQGMANTATTQVNPAIQSIGTTTESTINTHVIPAVQRSGDDFFGLGHSAQSASTMVQQALSAVGTVAEGIASRLSSVFPGIAGSAQRAFAGLSAQLIPRGGGSGMGILPPVRGWQDLITQAFGQNGERGIDIGIDPGTPLVAGGSGTVTAVRNQGQAGLGLSVTIDLGNNVSEVIGHLDQALVNLGDQVAAGQPIGFSGGEVGSPTSGESSGPHTEVQILVNGQVVDPASVLGQILLGTGGATTSGGTVNIAALSAQGNVLTPGQIAGLLFQSGATPDEALNLTAIALAETGGATNAVGPTTDAGTPLGLFQFEPGTSAGVGLTNPNDPIAAARAAIELERTSGYTNWETFTSSVNNFMDFIQQAQAAIANPADVSGLSISAPGLQGGGGLGPSGALPSPQPVAPLSFDQLVAGSNEAQKALDALYAKGQEVATGTQHVADVVTQADLDQANATTQALKVTANVAIGNATEQELALSKLYATGASTEAITQQKNVANAAVESANTAYNAWKQSDQDRNTTSQKLHQEQIADMNNLSGHLVDALRQQYKDQEDVELAYWDKQKETVRNAYKDQEDAARKTADADLELLQQVEQKTEQAATDAADAQIKALTRSQEERATAEQRATDAQITQMQRATDAAVTAMQRQEQAQVAAIDAAAKARQQALDDQKTAQEGALDAQTQAQLDALQQQIDAPKAARRAQQEADLQAQIAAATGDQQKQLQDQLDQMREEDQDAQIQAQMDQIRQQADLRKQAIEKQIQDEGDAQKAVTDAEKQALATRLQDQENAYKQSAQDRETAVKQSLQDEQTAQKQALDDQTTSIRLALQTQKDDIKAHFKGLEDDRKTSLDNQLKALEREQQSELDRIDTWEKNVRKYYADVTSNYALQGQARTMIEQGDQQQILSLLHEYEPGWFTSGQNLGKSLIEGLHDADEAGFLSNLLNLAHAANTQQGDAAAPSGAPAGGDTSQPAAGSTTSAQNTVQQIGPANITVNVDLSDAAVSTDSPTLNTWITTLVSSAVNDAFRRLAVQWGISLPA